MKRTMATALVLLAAAAAPSQAALVYGTSAAGELVGSRTEANLVEGGNYAGDSLTVAWNIVNSGSFWTYTYSFTGFGSPAISHFILDLTDEVLDDPALVTNLSASPGSISLTPTRGTFTGAQPSNPGLAAPITGIKIDTGNTPDNATFSVTFRSNQAPVYGDIYFKGGNNSFAYNIGNPLHASSERISDFVARPNGTLAVPEPSSIALVGMGIAGLLGVRFRRRLGRA